MSDTSFHRPHSPFHHPHPVDAFQHASDLRWLFTDVDDTLTWKGMLPPETLTALQDLRAAGIKVVAVTGGCAGWCDQMAKLWPVEAVLGENGAFCMSVDKSQFRTSFYHPQKQMQQAQQVIKEQVNKLLTQYPGIELAMDQPFRFCDVAVNIAQNREPVDLQTVNALLSELRGIKVNGEPVKATVSSIHINIWVGEHNKRRGSENYLSALGISPEDIESSVGFIGDSPNDESMFGWLTHTFGVANIASNLEQMQHKPKYLLNNPGGYGFKELADILLGRR